MVQVNELLAKRRLAELGSGGAFEPVAGRRGRGKNVPRRRESVPAVRRGRLETANRLRDRSGGALEEPETGGSLRCGRFRRGHAGRQEDRGGDRPFRQSEHRDLAVAFDPPHPDCVRVRALEDPQVSVAGDHSSRRRPGQTRPCDDAHPSVR